MVVLRELPPARASFGAVKFTVPEDSPTGMVMVCPLDKVTTTGEPVTGAETEAV
ncbi:hypothetical protein POS17_0135 [Pseudomonas sp. Os17]|nr:hypothetical protein POS17_0135 [Pseudomonas sp. Os17]